VGTAISRGTHWQPLKNNGRLFVIDFKDQTKGGKSSAIRRHLVTADKDQRAISITLKKFVHPDPQCKGQLHRIDTVAPVLAACAHHWR
jgi:hypothetical protein